MEMEGVEKTPRQSRKRARRAKGSVTGPVSTRGKNREQQRLQQLFKEVEAQLSPLQGSSHHANFVNNWWDTQGQNHSHQNQDAGFINHRYPARASRARGNRGRGSFSHTGNTQNTFANPPIPQAERAWRGGGRGRGYEGADQDPSYRGHHRGSSLRGAARSRVGEFVQDFSSAPPSPFIGSPLRGRSVRGNSFRGGSLRGSPFRGDIVRDIPFRGGPSRGGPFRGGPFRGDPSRGDSSRGRPSRGGPSRRGPRFDRRWSESQDISFAGPESIRRRSASLTPVRSTQDTQIQPGEPLEYPKRHSGHSRRSQSPATPKLGATAPTVPSEVKDHILTLINAAPILPQQVLTEWFDHAFPDPDQPLDPETFNERYYKLNLVVTHEKAIRRMAGADKIGEFLRGINGLISTSDGQLLSKWLLIDPPLPPEYQEMIAGLQLADAEASLEEKCRSILTEVDSREWQAFIPFITQYLLFLRDINVDNLLDAYNLLSELLHKCNVALSNASCGEILLPTVVAYSQMLARFAIRLDRQPSLLANVQRSADGESSETLPERATNIIRHAFNTCLNDRTDPSNSTINGRKAGVYKLANICLKILFAVKKTGNAEQIFTSVYNSSPPLVLYPRAERVTYLYYLGRFLWTVGQWYRSQLALEHAYLNCPTQCLSQRRLILVFYVASNLILGRFPSAQLYARPEAVGFAQNFAPICQSIKKGDLETFRRLTDVQAPNARWLLHYRILLQIRNRCEVLVWRSLTRKVFLLAGKLPQKEKVAPSLNLVDFAAAYNFLDTRSQLTPAEVRKSTPGKRHTNHIFQQESNVQAPVYSDEEFEGVEDGLQFIQESVGMLPKQDPNILGAESKLSSLIVQGLIYGYLSHKVKRLAILGASKKPAVEAGFPKVWKTLTAKQDGQVPGWKKETGSTSVGGGRTIHLTNARPVGAGP